VGTGIFSHRVGESPTIGTGEESGMHTGKKERGASPGLPVLLVVNGGSTRSMMGIRTDSALRRILSSQLSPP